MQCNVFIAYRFLRCLVEGVLLLHNITMTDSQSQSPEQNIYISELITRDLNLRARSIYIGTFPYNYLSSLYVVINLKQCNTSFNILTQAQTVRPVLGT